MFSGLFEYDVQKNRFYSKYNFLETILQPFDNMGNLYEVCRELNVAISLELKETIKRGRKGEGLPILWLYETHTLLNYY